MGGELNREIASCRACMLSKAFGSWWEVSHFAFRANETEKERERERERRRERMYIKVESLQKESLIERERERYEEKKYKT